MTPEKLVKVLKILRKTCKSWPRPTVLKVADSGSPFQVLVSCLLSLRTRDEVTEAASIRLFKVADSPSALINLSLTRLERLIYPVAFYKNKAVTLKQVSKDLLDFHEGRVPASMDALLELKGVGRKTANLTLVLGFNKPGICVDIHVHRIFNRWGYLLTQSPDETEAVLREKLPRRYWKEINQLLVALGQNQCKPTSPICSTCCLEHECSKTGVGRSR